MSQEVPHPDYILRGSDGPVTSLCFLEHQPNYLVSGSQEGYITVWDLRTRRAVCTTAAHLGYSVLAILERKEGTVLTQGRDGWIHTWHLLRGTFSKSESLKYDHDGFCPITLFPQESGDLVAFPADNNSSVTILNLATKATVSKLTPPAETHGMPMRIKFTRHRSHLTIWVLVGYEDGSICLWDAETAAHLCKLSVHTESVMSFDFHPTLSKGVSGSVSTHLSTWSVSVSNANHISSGPTITLTNPGINCVLFRGDGKLLATGGWDSRIRLFGAKKLKPLAVLTCHSDSVHCLAFAPDNILAAGSKDKTISIWSLYK